MLVLIIPVGGILAAIAIPAYQDYSIKSRVSEAYFETPQIRQAITAHASETGYWPNSMQQAGIEAHQIETPYYQIQIAAEGSYQIIFKN